MSASSPDERSFARMFDGVAIALLGALAVIVALTFRDYGLGWDDYAHSEYGDLLLSLYGSGCAAVRGCSVASLAPKGWRLWSASMRRGCARRCRAPQPRR